MYTITPKSKPCKEARIFFELEKKVEGNSKENGQRIQVLNGPAHMNVEGRRSF
jgi:hypothetical protein